jgi:hypothetical protein
MNPIAWFSGVCGLRRRPRPAATDLLILGELIREILVQLAARPPWRHSGAAAGPAVLHATHPQPAEGFHGPGV